MSEWDRIVADLHNVFDVDRAAKACEALDKAADETWLPRLHRLLAKDKSFLCARPLHFRSLAWKACKLCPSCFTL